MHSVIFAILLFIHPIHTIYTNKDASNCFQSKQETTCSAQLTKCVKDKNCEQQISLFQLCQFGEPDQIFNGFCFSQWGRMAIETKNLIHCLINNCNLEYNSANGYHQLIQCIDRVTSSHKEQCDENCVQILQTQKQRFKLEEIQTIFSGSIQNVQASKIWKQAKQICYDSVQAKQQQNEHKQKQENDQL